MTNTQTIQKVMLSGVLLVLLLLTFYSMPSKAREPNDVFPLPSSTEYLNCQFIAHGVYRTLLNKSRGFSRIESVKMAKSIDAIYPQSLNTDILQIFDDYWGNSTSTPNSEWPFAYSINAFQICLENFMSRFPVDIFMIDEQAKKCATQGLILGDIYRHMKSKGKRGTLEYFQDNIPDYLLPIISNRLDYLQKVDDNYTGGSIEWLYYALMSAEALNCYNKTL